MMSFNVFSNEERGRVRKLKAPALKIFDVFLGIVGDSRAGHADVLESYNGN